MDNALLAEPCESRESRWTRPESLKKSGLLFLFKAYGLLTPLFHVCSTAMSVTTAMFSYKKRAIETGEREHDL